MPSVIILEFIFIVLAVALGVFFGNLFFAFVRKDITTSPAFYSAQRAVGLRSDAIITSPSKRLKEKQFIEGLTPKENE